MIVIVAIITIVAWFVMLKTHKYQNKMQLGAVGIAALFIVGYIFYPEKDGGILIMAWFLYGLSVLLEEFKILKRDWLFTRKSKLPLYTYENLEDIKIGDELKSENILYKKTHQNSISMNFKGEFNDEKSSPTHISDFDIYLTVLKGVVYLSTIDKEIELHRGEFWKIPAYTQRVLRGKKDTEFSVNIIKV